MLVVAFGGEGVSVRLAALYRKSPAICVVFALVGFQVPVSQPVNWDFSPVEGLG